jgi:uncharacterized protein (TIGR00297 family)
VSELLFRALLGLGVNGILAFLAYRSGSVRRSGVWAGIFLGTVIMVALGWSGFSILISFFILGTMLTKFGYSKKERLGTAEDRGGARGGSHAFANAGFPALFAVLAAQTHDPFWIMAFCGGFATALMDTAGSELGPLYGKKTMSLKTWKSVPPGTDGAISLEGTLGGVVFASLLALLAWMTRLVLDPLNMSWVVLGAVLGNLYEGLVGSRRLLPHTFLNASNTLLGGLLTGLLWYLFGR